MDRMAERSDLSLQIKLIQISLIYNQIYEKHRMINDLKTGFPVFFVVFCEKYQINIRQALTIFTINNKMPLIEIEDASSHQ